MPNAPIRLCSSFAVMLVLTATVTRAAGGKYTIVQLPDNESGSVTAAVYAVQTGAHLVVGRSATAQGGKFQPTVWVSFAGSEWFAEQYSSLAQGGGGAIHGAAVTNSAADGVLVGDAEDALGRDRAVLWRGGLPETAPASLLPDFQESTATDVVRIPGGTGADRYGVVGNMKTETGATRGFFCLPEVGDEVLIAFLGQLPTLGGMNCEATGIARTQDGFRIVGRAQTATEDWLPCTWEAPDIDALLRVPRAQADAVEYGLITALTAPGPGTVHHISPSGDLAVGSAENAEGVTVPQVWQRQMGGGFAPLAITLPKGVTEGEGLGANADGRVVGYLKLRRKGKVTLVAFTCSPAASPVLTNLQNQIKSGKGEFKDIFTGKRPTGIAADGAICGQGPRKQGDPNVALPFILNPPS